MEAVSCNQAQITLSFSGENLDEMNARPGHDVGHVISDLRALVPCSTPVGIHCVHHRTVFVKPQNVEREV